MYGSAYAKQLGHKMALYFPIFCKIFNESTQQSFDHLENDLPTTTNMAYRGYCIFQMLPRSMVGYAT